MDLLKRKVKSALLDNIDGQVGRAFGANIGAWTAWVQDGAFSKTKQARTLLAMKAYWNGQTDKKRVSFERHGFEAFACRSQAANKINANKSSADIVITIDAMDLVHEMRGLKEVILFTADTDFVPLVNRLQQKGLHVVVVGNEGDPSSAIFRERGAEVISVAAIKEACSYVSPNKKKSQPLPEVEVASEPEPGGIADVSSPRQPAVKPKERKKPRKKPKQQSTFDLKLAADLVREVCMQTPNRPASKAAIEGALARVPGFTKSPTKEHAAWLGCNSLNDLLQVLPSYASGLEAARNPNGANWQIKFAGDLPSTPSEAA